MSIKFIRNWWRLIKNSRFFGSLGAKWFMAYVRFFQPRRFPKGWNLFWSLINFEFIVYIHEQIQVTPNITVGRDYYVRKFFMFCYDCLDTVLSLEFTLLVSSVTDSWSTFWRYFLIAERTYGFYANYIKIRFHFWLVTKLEAKSTEWRVFCNCVLRTEYRPRMEIGPAYAV